jgi:hypothetical protein
MPPDESDPAAAPLPALEQYHIVAQRRQQWDTLLWQMPTMVLTGEAFLFTISLGPSTTQTGRIVASLLAFVVAMASLHSLSSHRLSELADSAWLHEHEQTHGAPELHGLSWRARRGDVVARELHSPRLTDRLIARFARIRSITVWFWTMALICVLSVGVLIISAGFPSLLTR